MKQFLTAVLVLILFNSKAQQTATFESLSLPSAESFWEGPDGFTNDVLFFQSVWDTSFGGYLVSGFAYSNKTDSITPGYANAYSSRAGGGFGGSEKFAVGYDTCRIEIPSTFTNSFLSVRITNSSYAYYSMLNGDAFAKKFGGETGNDPDFFKVIFEGKSANGSLVGLPVEAYLADFRFDDNSLDYIVSDWIEVDLSPIGNDIASLNLRFESSDTGEFGINTPKYVCIDQLIFEVSTGLASVLNAQTIVYPNPANAFIHLEVPENQISMVELLSLTGQQIQQFTTAPNQLNCEDLPNGIYLLRITFADGSQLTRKQLIQH